MLIYARSESCWFYPRADEEMRWELGVVGLRLGRKGWKGGVGGCEVEWVRMGRGGLVCKYEIERRGESVRAVKK